MKLKRINSFALGLAATTVVACGAPPEESTPEPVATPPAALAVIELSNPSEFSRTDEVTALDLDMLGVSSDDVYRIESAKGELPSQLSDRDGDGSVDSIVFAADFGPGQRRSVRLLAGTPQKPAKRTQAEVSIKEGGEWDDKVYKGGEFVNVDAITPPPQYTDHSQYIRYEGPGIESDKVGYRIYLDWRNGFDIFGKSTDAMVLQDVGLDGYDSYHEPADWGLDILKVGDAVGIGGYGFWDGEKIVRVSETSGRATRIVEDGSLTSTLEITYDDWRVPAMTTDLTALLSMTAGSRLVQTRLEASPDMPNLAVGIVKLPDTEVIEGETEMSGYAWTYVATWGPQAIDGSDLGMALFFRNGARLEQTEDEHNIVSVMRPENGKVEYYFAAVWSQEPGGVATRDEFVQWLEQESEKLTMPLRTRIRTSATDSRTSGDIDAATALGWSTRLAQSEIERLGDSLQYGGFDSDGTRDAIWSYTTGLLVQAMDDLSSATGQPQFADWGKATIDSYVTDDGEIRTYDASLFNIDHVNSGKMLLRYLERSGDDKYRKAADAIRAQLEDHPRTSEGAFWHKQRYPWQLWLDGVYMGMPFLAHYSQLAGDTHGIEEAVNEFLVTRRHLRDDATGLYWHAWDEKAEQVWADPDTGLSEYFWSRGMGWYAMALVDILDFVPAERADLRQPIINAIGEFADALLEHRTDGVWYQVMDRPQATGNYPEASGSSMFVYMLAKAVNKGYLDESYAGAAADAYASVLREFIAVQASGAVSLTNVCRVAGLGYGRDGSYGYYMSEPVMSNDPKGVGPFIMAGVEISKMLSEQNQKTGSNSNEY